jgi:hypothetical protein
MVERSKACTVYDRSNIGIAGSDTARGMDVCPRFSVLWCPVSVEALRWADPTAFQFSAAGTAVKMQFLRVKLNATFVATLF